MPDRTPDNAPQHVTAPFIGRQYAVNHQEGAGADVVGNDTQGVVCQIIGPSYFCSGFYKALEQVDIVIVVHTLHDGSQALQPHAGIHRGFWQRMQLAGRVPVILHEHQVPYLDIAVTVFFRGTGRATGDFLAVIVENLRTGSTGPGVPH